MPLAGRVARRAVRKIDLHAVAHAETLAVAEDDRRSVGAVVGERDLVADLSEPGAGNVVD